MPNMTMNIIGFQDYQPDPEDLCSLCGVNIGRAAMIEAKNKIHICMECVDLLGVIKKERDDMIRDEAIGALEREWESETDRPAYKFEVIYDAIAAGKIPGIRID